MSERVCENCRWFVKAEPQHVYGDCHRLPPQFSFTANFYEEDGMGVSRRKRIDISRDRSAPWPNLHQDDFCGEHQLKEATHAD